MTSLFQTSIQKNPRLSGVLIALLGALLMSLDPIFIRFSGVSGFDTAFLFGLFTTISIPLFIQWIDPRGFIGALRASGWPMVLSGLLMLGSATSLVFSIKLTTVANTFLILSIIPAMTAFFCWVFLGEVTKRITLIAISVAMLGVAIVAWGSLGSVHIAGDALALSAVIFVSLNQTLVRKFPDMSRMASVGMGGFFLAVTMFFLATPSDYSVNTWVIMGIMGLFTAPFGRVLPRVAIRYITAPEVGMILMIEAALAPLLAFTFFAEIPALASFIGGGVILVTILVYARATARDSQ